MKFRNYIKSAIRGGMLLTALVFGGQLQAQLNGTYTINSATVTGGTNFQTWTAFATAFNAAAITGPVTVNVVTDELNTAAAIQLNNNTGSSATNTVTINGNSKKLQGGTALTNAVLRLNGADYIAVKNVIIENTNAATPGGVWLSNNANYNEINGCDVSFTSYAGTSSLTYYISLSTSVSSPTSAGSSALTNPGNFNVIKNCKMYTQTGSTGPYYGVTINGNTADYTSVAQNNTMEGCIMTNFYFYGIYVNYGNGVQVVNNDISRNNATGGGSATLYGIYSYYPYGTGRSSMISGNSIHDLPFKGATLTTTNLSTIYGFYVYYPYGNATYKFIMDKNSVKDVYYTTGSRYVYYVYYPTFIDMTNNYVDNVDGTSTSSVSYDYYVYYPTDIKFNGNYALNSATGGYLYIFYLYYGKVNTYVWNEFEDNHAERNSTVNYMYAAYVYYYNGTNNWKANRNYVVNNQVTGSTGYFYFYLYYYNNFQVCNNVVAGNRSNTIYIYIYSGLSGTFTAEVRNNTFVGNTSNAPTPGSSYIYCYIYLYYHTVWFTGNIIDLKNFGPNTNYYRYLYMYLSYSNPANLKEFNDNTYSLNNNFTYPYWYFNGTNYTDWAGFSGAGMNGSRDNGDDPKWVNEATHDWRPGAWTVQNNVDYRAITDQDANNVKRNKTKHDRGGLETNTDLEAVSTNFTVPSTVCAGYTTGATWLILKSNYAYDKARNFNVSYAVNGGPKISRLVTKQLAQGDTVKVFFPTPLVLNNYGPARIAIFVDLPDDKNSNDSFIFTTFVKPAPGGGVMTYTSTPTWAYYQPSKSNDVTVLGQKVEYAVNSPRIYGNKDYKGNGGGDNWEAFVSATTSNGTVVSGASLIQPSTAGSDMIVSFVTSNKSLEDSIITITVRVNDLGNGCDTLIKRNILIYPTIVPGFTKPTQACLGENILFENKSTVTSGNMEFEWDFGTGNPDDKTDAPDPVFAYTKEGTYKVKMIARTLPYGFPSVDSTSFIVNPIPVVDFAKKNACTNDPLEFASKTTPSSSNLTWDFGDGKGNSNAANPTYKYSKNGSYVVTLTANLNGCIAKLNQRVYQFENPKADYKVIDGACENIPFVFANSSTISSGNLGSYWNFDDGSISTTGAPKHLFRSSGDKKVKLIITSEFGCKDSIIKTVTVDESPKTKFANGPACSLTPTLFTNLTPAIVNTIANYDWTFSDGGTSRLESPSKSWSTLGPKTATLTVTLNNGCKETFSKTLNVLVQPKAQFSAADVCAGEPVTFNNGSEWKEGVISYNWDFGDGTNATESDPVHPYNVNLTTTYNVTLKASIEGGCVDSFTKQVIIHEGPKTCDFIATPDYSYGYYGMKFEPMDAQGKPGAQGTVNYTWIIENGGKQNAAAVQHNFVKDGVYTVTMYAVTKSTGCECSITKKVVMDRAGADEFISSGVSVFPNPSEGNYNVLLSENFGKVVTIEMRSTTGAVVKVMQVDNTGIIPVDAHGLSNGMYYVRISSGENTAVRKLNISK